MTAYYLDASAWVKRYCIEAGSSWVRQLFNSGALMCCATLGVVEVAATLARKTRAGEIDRTLGETMARRLRRDWSGFYQIEMTSGVLEAALEAAGREALKGADAVHLASALIVADHLRRHATELVFVASDRELEQAAARAGLPTTDPAEK